MAGIPNLFRRFTRNGLRSFSTSSIRSLSSFQHLQVDSPSKHVRHVQLNRPEKRNALNLKLWAEIGTVFNELDEDAEVRAVVLSGNGKMFSAGIDLSDTGFIQSDSSLDIARNVKRVAKVVKDLQDNFTALEKCQKPVISAIHGACVGAGIDLVTAADVRICSAETWFTVKEVEIGLAADVGTLQRLPRIVGNQSWVRDICFTARKFTSEEAERQGLVSGVHKTPEETVKAALDMAEHIASFSPVAVQGTKHYLVYARDHSVEDGLQSIHRWNGAMLQSEDFVRSITAAMTKEKAEFQDF